MAYLRELRKTCGPCGKEAKFEVIGTWNESYGYFCRVCGERLIKKLEKEASK